MSFFNKLFGAHTANLQSALSQTARRHSLLAKNLANLNTPGYKREDIDFGIQLQRSSSAYTNPDSQSDLSSLEGLSGRELAEAIRARRISRFQQQPFKDQRSVRVDGSSVTLENEVTALAETELRYQTISDMTAQYFSGIKSVIREGR